MSIQQQVCQTPFRTGNQLRKGESTAGQRQICTHLCPDEVDLLRVYLGEARESGDLEDGQEDRVLA